MKSIEIGFKGGHDRRASNNRPTLIALHACLINIAYCVIYIIEEDDSMRIVNFYSVRRTNYKIIKTFLFTHPFRKVLKRIKQMPEATPAATKLTLGDTIIMLEKI